MSSIRNPKHWFACVLVAFALDASADDLGTLFDAIDAGDDAKVDALIAAHPVLAGSHDGYGVTPLVHAVLLGRTGIAAALVDEGADPDQPDMSTYLSPLHHAAWNGDAAATRVLVEGGADLELPGDQGLTPVMIAARVGAADAVKVLVGAGASLEAKDDMGATTLFHAAAARSPAVLEYLKETGHLDEEARDDLDRTPLHWAAQAGRMANVKLLLEAGFSPGVCDKYGSLPWDVTADPKISKVIEARWKKEVKAQKKPAMPACMFAALTATTLPPLGGQGMGGDVLVDGDPDTPPPPSLGRDALIAEVKRGVWMEKSAVSNCIEPKTHGKGKKKKKKKKGGKGPVTSPWINLILWVDGSGNLARSEVTAFGGAASDPSACVQKALAGLAFPEPEEGPILVSVSMDLQ